MQHVDGVSEEPIAERGQSIVILALGGWQIAGADDHVVAFLNLGDEEGDGFDGRVAVGAEGDDEIPQHLGEALHIGGVQALSFLADDVAADGFRIFGGAIG